MNDSSKPATERSSEDRQLAEELVERARNEGVDLVGPDGLLSGVDQERLGSGVGGGDVGASRLRKHDPAGNNTGNSRNCTRSKKVLTDVGPVEIEVPRDRGDSFDPQLGKNTSGG
jgi:putative transposase